MRCTPQLCLHFSGWQLTVIHLALLLFRVLHDRLLAHDDMPQGLKNQASRVPGIDGTPPGTVVQPMNSLHLHIFFDRLEGIGAPS